MTDTSTFPQTTLNELVDLKLNALYAAETYSEALKTQAATHHVRLASLRTVVTAAACDRLADLAGHTGEVMALLEVLCGERDGH